MGGKIGFSFGHSRLVEEKEDLEVNANWIKSTAPMEVIDPIDRQ